MSNPERDWHAVYRAVFFWTGVLMTIACIALVFAGNTELGYRLEHTGFPLSWAFAAVALLEFVAVELCHQSSLARRRKR